MFNLSPIFSQHASHQTTNYPKTNRINPDTNVQKIYTNIKLFFPGELNPSVLPLLKKHKRLGHAGIVDHSVIYQYQPDKVKYEQRYTA